MKISPQYLNALMNGRRAPNVQRLRAASLALGTSVSYLALTTEDWTPDAAADAAQQRGSRADMLAEVAARGPAMLTTEDTAAANAWLRRYVRVFVRDNQVTEVRFNFW